MRAGRACAALFLSAALAACGEHSRKAGSGAAARAPRTILLVVLDGARADHLGVYGHAHDPMPALARLAEHAIVFEDALTASTGTNSALASLLTGCWPDTHGLGSLKDLGEHRLRESVETLAERLRAAQWTTVAAVALPQLAAGFSGLGQGFETYLEPPFPGEGALTAQEIYYRLSRALEPLGTSETPLFVWAHFADARTKTRPDADLARPFLEAHLAPFRAERADVAAVLANAAQDPARALQDLERVLARARGSPIYDAYQAALHDARLATIDRSLAALLDTLERMGRLEDALVVVTGTRGELYEGVRDPTGPSFPDALVRVPLLVSAPGMDAQRESATVRTIDLCPTILELAGAGDVGAIDGSSLRDLMVGRATDPRIALAFAANFEWLAAFDAEQSFEYQWTDHGRSFTRHPQAPLSDLASGSPEDARWRALIDALGEHTPRAYWTIRHAWSSGGELRVLWRFDGGYSRGELLESDGEVAPGRPGEGTRVDGAAMLRGESGRLRIDGNRRDLAMRLTLASDAPLLDERAVFVGAVPLRACSLPRVPSAEEVPWPDDEAGQPFPPGVDFAHKGDTWWQLTVGGEEGHAVEILLARYPPSRPDEELAVTVAVGEVRAVPGRFDAVWLAGTTPFEANIDKRPSENLALAVSIDGEEVPVDQIRWRGRRFAPPGEITLYLPDWMAGVTDALDELPAQELELAPGQVRIGRRTRSLPSAERVGSSKPELEFVRWLGNDE
jgi:arylsulfatase A-like enzyme